MIGSEVEIAMDKRFLTIIEQEISRYYPLNIEAFDPEYEETAEYKRLIARILDLIEDGSLVQGFISDIESILRGNSYRVINRTLFSFLDRCITLDIENKQLKNKKNQTVLVLCISVLGKYYCLYEKTILYEYDKDGSSLGFITSEDFSVATFNHRLVDMLQLWMEEKGYTKLDQDALMVNLPQHTFVGVPRNKFNVHTALFRDTF